MSKLSQVSGDECVKALAKKGYVLVRQKGSHMRLRHPTNPNMNPITVPRHTVIGKGLLKKIIRDASLTPEEFLELL